MSVVFEGVDNWARWAKSTPTFKIENLKLKLEIIVLVVFWLRGHWRGVLLLLVKLSVSRWFTYFAYYISFVDRSYRVSVQKFLFFN